MTRLFFWAKFYLILIFLITFIFICIAGYILWIYSPELPSYEKIKKYQPSLSSRVYTSDGLLLEKFFIKLLKKIFLIPVIIKVKITKNETKNGSLYMKKNKKYNDGVLVIL